MCPSGQQFRLGAVILCGGDSARMGTAKAWLDFDGRPLLQRVVSAVARAANPVVVSAAAEQDLPELAPQVQVVRDTVPGVGPLQGLADALAALGHRCDAVFVCGCDAPFVTPAYINRLAGLLGEHQAAVPVLDGYRQPLSAVYRVSVAGTVREQLARGRRSMMGLLDAIAVREVQPAQWADLDPQLDAPRSFNTPQEYRQALEDWRRRNST